MGVPEQLHSILDILIDFHKTRVLDILESSTSPNVLNTIRKQLANDSNILIKCIESDGNYINPDADFHAVSCIDKLKQFLYPSNAILSSMTIYWIEQIFEESPFTLSIEHTKRIKKEIDNIDGAS